MKKAMVVRRCLAQGFAVSAVTMLAAGWVLHPIGAQSPQQSEVRQEASGGDDPSARKRPQLASERSAASAVPIMAVAKLAPRRPANLLNCSTQVIVDGGFETGGIPSTFWDPETSTNFGTPLCNVGSCGTGGGSSLPFAGLIWAWFGGLPAVETATLGQTVTIAAASIAHLTFQMRVGTVSSPFTDVLNVRVDGAIVHSYPEPAVAEGAYTLRTVNLTGFANGAAHSLLFEYIGPTTGTGSYVVDDVALNVCPKVAPPPAGALVISEFRLRGPDVTNGANDEFIEVYNASGTEHVVSSGSGTGYGVAASDGLLRCTIPDGTVIPNRGHYLCANSVNYSLSGYPAGSGATAAGDATYTTDIPDNAGIALFNNNVPANFTLANRLDAVGSTSEANTVYKEGAGYAALTPFAIDYSFTRRPPGGCTGSAAGTNCNSVSLIQTTPGPTTTQVQDTNSNANDFFLADTNGTSTGGQQRLGSPGPENLTSPTSLDGFALTASKLDTCERRHEPPNVVRDFTSVPSQNSTWGTYDVRRTFTNTTGVAITRLRFRIVDITTFPSISGVADLRPRTSTDVVVTVDRPPCDATVSTVTVRGTTLEQPPSQPNGAGFYGSLSVGAITTGTPLAAGASVDVHFLLGLQQLGAVRFCVAAETVPATSAQVHCVIGTGDGLVTLSKTRSDFNGDGTGDIAVYRPTTGQWFIRNQPTVQFGDLSDVPVPGDYNGDDVEDVAVFRPSTNQWLVRSQFTVQWGDRGDVPVPGDFNGDGQTDVAVYRPSTGMWFVKDQFSVSFGGPGGYVPVVGDYNGDGTDDVAVFQPSTGMWFVRNQLALDFGDPGDRPVPGDYDDDGKTDIAIYRPSTGQWFVRNLFTVQFGDPGDIPVPRDYDGNGSVDVAIYRASTGQWFVKDQFVAVWGGGRDIPIPRTAGVPLAIAGDYDGDGATDIAVHRAASNQWFVRNILAVTYGDAGDIPIPADYNGDRRMDVAVYRPSTGHWFVRNQPTVQFGDPSDKPIPGDYNGDGLMDVAVYRPSTRQWFVRNQLAISFGDPNDVPMPGDYNGDRVTDIAVYRPSTGHWVVRNQPTVQFGDPGDIPVPADYNGDGKMDVALYRPSTRTWYVRNQFAVQFGDTGDVPAPGDYNGDGLSDIAVYRPSTGTWYVRNVLTQQFGDAMHVPIVRIGAPQ